LGRRIEHLSGKISNSAQWLLENPPGKTEGDTRIQVVLKALNDCKDQWGIASKVLDFESQGFFTSGPFSESSLATPVGEHDIRMSKTHLDLLIRMINTLIATSTEARTYQKLFDVSLGGMNAFNLKDGNFRGRSKTEQQRWQSKVQERQGVFEGYIVPTASQASDTKSPSKPEPSPTAKRRQTSDKMGWCPVLKDFIPTEHGKAAHILPHGLGSKMYDILLGGKPSKTNPDEANNLMDPRNGIWVAGNVEKALDQAQIALMPTDTDAFNFDKKTYDIKLVVLDPHLLEHGKDMILQWGENNEKKRTWNDVNGQILDFCKASSRPGRRFLYTSCLLKQKQLRNQQPKNFEVCLKTLNRGMDTWATPGSYLDRGKLVDIAEREMVERRFLTLVDTQREEALQMAQRLEIEMVDESMYLSE
jgi:HNH endonuclease